MSRTAASTSKWSLDYTKPPPTSSKSIAPLDPPGFDLSLFSSGSSSRTIVPSPKSGVNIVELKEKKAWEIATGPAKNIPMQGFMMYMTGGGVQIFSVMSVWYLLRGAVAGIANVNKTFAHLSSSSQAAPDAPTPSYWLQKSAFVLCQIALLALGVWKVNAMGLLPTHSSDWLAFREPTQWE